MPSRVAALAVVLIACSFAAPQARAEWPDRPIRWVVPFGPGGANDLIPRVVADAVRKGNLHNLFNTYQYMASVAYDLEKFQEAEDAVQKASELPEGRSSTQLGRLKASIDQALQLQKQQEAVKAAAAAAGVGNGNAAPPANP